MIIKYIKKFFSICIKLTFLFIVSILFFAALYYYNNNLFLWEVKLLWPQQKFYAEKFRTGTTKDRASMVADLIESKSFIDTPISQISELLGPSTGYSQHSYYAYVLTERGRANWVLNFMHDENNNVINIIIKKSCCSITRKIAVFIFIKIGDLIVPFLKGDPQ